MGITLQFGVDANTCRAPLLRFSEHVACLNEAEGLWSDMQDTDLKLRYVLANEADVYLASDNVTQFSYVTAVDAVKQEVIPLFLATARVPFLLTAIRSLRRSFVLSLSVTSSY